jgi:DNA-binding transcriptional LysR family regulator
MRTLETSVKRMVVIDIIIVVNIYAMNLNLLVVLDALAAEENVTRAARRLGLTQSAVSNALAQLRQQVGDPLFVRSRRGVVPTERARELAGPVRQALALLAGALEGPGGFEPARATRSFVLMASDYAEHVLLPPLLRRIGGEAPGVRLEVRPLGVHEVPPELERGEADLMIGYHDALPGGHHAERLFHEEYVCIVRRGHPRAGKRLTLARYLELGHVLVSQTPGSAGSVDRALARLGKTRTIAARVSHFLLVPALVAQTDLVAALSRRVAEPAAKHLPLVLHAPPLALPRSTVTQVWHARVDADPAHRWLRSLVRDVSREA